MLVYLHLAEGFEEIEALSVVNILRRAKIDIKTVSITGKKEVMGAHGITVLADILFEDAKYSKAQMIVLPGGMPGTNNLEEHKGLEDKIKEFYNSEKWLAAICAAPSILGKLNLLKDKEATCYPGFEKYLTDANCSKASVVVSDKIITSRGPGTAAYFAFKLVEIIKGNKLARKLKEVMIFGIDE
jgi:4-methyl-5(b-hydroxyethyl)-thiazole monophosphate biosynthesis